MTNKDAPTARKLQVVCIEATVFRQVKVLRALAVGCGVARR